MVSQALFLAAGGVFLLSQVALAVFLGARRDGVSPLTLEFWRS